MVESFRGSAQLELESPFLLLGDSVDTDRRLFDNLPAMDVLQLDNNEGNHNDQPLNILFAGKHHWKIL